MSDDVLKLRPDQGEAAVPLPLRGRMVIGSDAERVDMLLAGAGVEPVHCTIGRVKGGGWALQDLGTDAGTRVNGAAVTTTRLAEGDVLEIGARRLEVVGPPREPARPTGTIQRKAPAPPVVPGFRVERLLGRGSSGNVWAAIQESLDRRVALKTLAPNLAADADFVRRFQEEARAAARLAHPNVVHVYDVGQAGAVHYLAMEVMDGGCLESRLASQGPLPWRVALEAIADAARALVYAESRGIVHRDIKPANLMVSEDGSVKLADLGLAAQVEQASLSQTAERKVLGTPHFIAPEVVRGQPADARSDLYSLGATAYRLLSGVTPFEGQRTADILRAVLNDEPRPLAERVPGLPAGVAAAVHRLLAKDPDARYGSARELLDDLDHLHLGSGAAAGASGSKRLLLIGGVALLVAGAAALALLGPGERSAPSPPGPTEPGPTRPVVDPGPQPDPGEDVASSQSGGPETTDPSQESPDDDAAERAFEQQAAAALARLDAEELDGPTRIARLRELAGLFPGTDAALGASGRADELEAAASAEAAQQSSLDTRRAELVARLRSAADPGLPPRFGRAIEALRVVPGQELWASDPTFLDQRAQLVDGLLEQALAYASGGVAASGEHEASGDFAASREVLEDLVAALRLPDFPGAPPARADAVSAQRAEALGLLDSIGEREVAFGVRQVEGDRRAIATGFGGPEGLEAELRRGDLDAAHARLESLLTGLATADARDRITPLLADVDASRRARAALVDAWSQPGWRRRAVLDPRGRKLSTEECVGIGADGVRLADGVVGWGAFIARPRALANLFHERVNGGWSDEVSTQVGAFVRLASTLDAVAQTTEMLAPGSMARFTPGEVEALIATFDINDAWSSSASGAAAVAREREAARALGLALNAVSDERWAEAEARLERVLAEHESALVVLLLSDGGTL